MINSLALFQCLQPLRAVTEVVVTKAGKETSGLDRFYSSLYGKAVPGLSFFALSLIDLSERGSFPLRIEQSIRTEAEKAASKAKAEGCSPAAHLSGSRGSLRQQ